MKIVRCVDDEGVEEYLTAGKEYRVITDDKSSLLVHCDNGENVWFLKSRFEDVVTVPTNPKPNSIESIANEKPKVVVKGVGPDTPTVVNEKGGKQSQVLYRFDLLDPAAMFEMTRVLDEGAKKYGDDENWRKIDVRSHLNHLLIHAYAYLAGDESDDHLSHIMCRAMFAQAVELESETEQ